MCVYVKFVTYDRIIHNPESAIATMNLYACVCGSVGVRFARATAELNRRVKHPAAGLYFVCTKSEMQWKSVYAEPPDPSEGATITSSAQAGPACHCSVQTSYKCSTEEYTSPTWFLGKLINPYMAYVYKCICVRLHPSIRTEYSWSKRSGNGGRRNLAPTNKNAIVEYMQYMAMKKCSDAFAHDDEMKESV